ncbi:hypothetical protein [Aeromonas hydrophila]|uniref:hypothetical protein n=1 Tax=Aeromonas hydrophila TaxID=644 RepID=UPI001F27D06A|nr:hypothetical protein [Aeromonas hydrophila]BDC83362.1 hypothetical protein NUITMVA1_33050 [Aeromonas hydrophila]
MLTVIKFLKSYSSSKKNKKKQKKTNNPLANSVHGEINYFILDENDFCKHIRAEHRRDSVDILNERHALFIEAGLGYGLYGFVSSLVNTIENRKTKCIKIDLSDVISKNQIDDKVKDDTGHNLASLIYTLGLNRDSVYFIIFDKIRGNADVEAILYLLNLPDIFSMINENIFLIYSSSVNIKLFNDIRIKLKELDLHETEIVLRNAYGLSRFTSDEISKIHEQSEGVVKKLEQIMYFLDSSSVQEVISQEDIFDDVFHSECIPGITQKQIDLLISDPSKELTFRMLKILSILKNGETLSNLKKDKMGLKLGPRNTKDLIQFELATTIHIDSATTLIRVNPIIKDYVLSKMSRDEKFKIADAYLRVTIIETKEGIKFSSSNRKIYDNGYNTEEDNSNTLLKLSIEECKSNINSEDLSTEDSEMNSRKLNKLLYLSRSYVYLLCNSSRFNEAISAVSNLIPTIQDVDSENIYKYYHRIAYAYRMKSNHDEAKKFLTLCEDLCPDADKETLESIYTEKLYLLKNKDIDNAAAFARNNKNKFHKNSVPYILSDVTISLTKEKGERIKSLESQEKKARKLNFHTLANNILFILNDEKNDAEKINDLNQVIRTDSSAYNICRAIIYKNEVLVRNNRFEKIKDSDINNLINIYNYLFRQKFDNLFTECHSILWSIAEHKKNNELIVFIFYKGTIVWKLNSDIESETKYNTLISNVTNQDNIPLLGNFHCP